MKRYSGNNETKHDICLLLAGQGPGTWADVMRYARSPYTREYLAELVRDGYVIEYREDGVLMYDLPGMTKRDHWERDEIQALLSGRASKWEPEPDYEPVAIALSRRIIRCCYCGQLNDITAHDPDIDEKPECSRCDGRML